MTITWILVANASLCKIYENLGPKKGLKLVGEWMHPESRQKNGDLVTDRVGSSGNGAMQPHTEPKQHEALRFAQSIAQRLYHGRARNAFKRAILVAPPAFMGLLNANLDNGTAQLVSDRVDKDYTKAPEDRLSEHLASRIYL